MKSLIMTREELEITVTNGRWFAGFRCRWKAISPDRYRVTTNYVPAGVR